MAQRIETCESKLTHITYEKGYAMQSVLECQSLEKYYGRGTITKALNGISFSVAPQEFIAIMGPSGSGKTTLLNCISTIDQVTAGKILIDGEDITRMRPRDIATFRRNKLGFIFQDSNLLDTLTARENIALPLSLQRVSVDQIKARVEACALRLGIKEVLDRFPYELSGGQRQRVAASRAIVTNPALVLADEPTGSLDSRNARLLLETLTMMNTELATTILMVTHDALAASFSHRVLFIKDGALFNQIVRGDTPRSEYFEKIMDVVSFLGGDVADVR